MSPNCHLHETASETNIPSHPIPSQPRRYNAMQCSVSPHHAKAKSHHFPSMGHPSLPRFVAISYFCLIRLASRQRSRARPETDGRQRIEQSSWPVAVPMGQESPLHRRSARFDSKNSITAVGSVAVDSDLSSLSRNRSPPRSHGPSTEPAKFDLGHSSTANAGDRTPAQQYAHPQTPHTHTLMLCDNCHGPLPYLWVASEMSSIRVLSRHGVYNLGL